MSELVVGSLAGLSDNGFVIDVASGSRLTQPGMVLQVVSTTKTDTFATSSTSFVNITGLSVSITPSSTSSKILILAEIAYGVSASGTDSAPQFKISGGNTASYVGDAAGSRTRAVFGGLMLGGSTIRPTVLSGNLNYLDSPSTTSSVAYQIQMTGADGNNAFLNRVAGDADADAASRVRGASTITVMEIAG